MTIRVNREIVLKGLLNKVKEAKKLNMQEVKIPIKELDDLAYVVYQLMAEDISKILSLKDPKEETPKKQEKKPVVRKVLEKIVDEEPEIIEEKTPEPVVQPKPPELPKKIEPIVQKPIVPEIQEMEEEPDDEPFNGLYGGTW